MIDYLMSNYSDEPFKLFSPLHSVMLGSICTIGLLIFLFRNNLREKKINRLFRFGLASFMVLLELSVQTWIIAAGEWSITTSLPLHLCNISLFLSIVMLVSKSYLIYEVTYFWGLGGAVQALLTPDLAGFVLPDFIIYQFFLSHGAIVFACLFMIFAEKYRPAHSSVWKTFIMTNIYAAVIAVFNLATGSNYLYICHKPSSPSLLDFLGPWPWYVLSLEFVLIFMCYLYFSPFYIYDLLKARQKSAAI
jgi:hypothetical integral membrane protein (TIGR02206 family)